MSKRKLISWIRILSFWTLILSFIMCIAEPLSDKDDIVDRNAGWILASFLISFTAFIYSNLIYDNRFKIVFRKKTGEGLLSEIRKPNMGSNKRKPQPATTENPAHPPFDSKEAYNLLITQLNHQTIKYEDHGFPSGSRMIDVWHLDLFYVIQIESNRVGFSNLSENEVNLSTVADEYVYDWEAFNKKVKELFV